MMKEDQNFTIFLIYWTSKIIILYVKNKFSNFVVAITIVNDTEFRLILDPLYTCTNNLF